MKVRLARRRAVGVVACAVLGLSVALEASTANAAVNRTTTSVALPADALSAMQAAFSADSLAQLNAGLGVSNATPTNPAARGAGAADISAIETRDADVAAYTELNGGPVWDSARTTLSDVNVTGATGSTITVSVDVTQMFHIEGTSYASFADAPMSYTGVDNPYTVTLTDASGSWRIDSLEQTPTPGQPAPVSGTAAQVRGRAALRQWHHRKPRFRIHRESLVARAASWDTDSAISYASVWWNSFNSAFPQYPDDCMNFVSQIINAGGEATGSVWYPGSDTWINVNDFYTSQRQWTSPDSYYAHYSGSNNDTIEGDAIAWDWGGIILNGNFDMQHETYVMGESSGTLFYVTSHTSPRWNYPSTSEFAYASNTLYLIERPKGL